jgi:hypothetical protein
MSINLTLAVSAMLLSAPTELPEDGLRPPSIQFVQETESKPAAPARRPPRRAARRRAQPVPEPVPAPPPAPPPRADIAPMPNRSLQAPTDPRTRETTRLRPDLIRPRDLPNGQPDNEFTERQDRLFRDPAPGARLQIPFSY